MSCERFDELINLFLDGRLDQGQERLLREHLSGCDKCAERLALLQSAEAKARKIEIKEPSQEYWDTFVGRVRAKIAAREEESRALGFKKALESIFTFSPLKIKVAAALVSIILVFIIGKQYIDYRGREIVPGQKIIQPEQPPGLETMDMEKKEVPPEAERKEKPEPVSKKPEAIKERAAPVGPEKRRPRQEAATGEREVLTKKEEPAVEPEVVEERPSPVGIPAPPERLAEEAEEPAKRQLETPKAEPVGAGVEEKAEERVSRDMTSIDEKAPKVEEVRQKMKAEKPESKKLALRSIAASFRATRPPDHFVVDEITLPNMQEDDTSLHVDDLARAIEAWKAFIQENPEDSLTKEGYLQVATAYYLLVKLTGDTTRISEGSKTIEEYIGRAKDRAIKDQLNDRVRKIEAMRQR